MYHIGCKSNCPGAGLNNGRSGETRQARLTFLRKELLYDIRNNAYIEGHVMGEEQQHAQHTLVDIGEEGNVDRVSRILGLVHAAAVDMLYPYTKEQISSEGEEVDDKQQDPEEYVIDLTVPESFSRTTVNLLSKLIHEFMVYRVLYDWLCITNPKQAEHWYNKAAEAEREIDRIKSARTGVLTRPARPF